MKLERGGRNRIGGGTNGKKKSWEEGEIGGKSREEGEKEKLGVGRIEPDGPGCGHQKVGRREKLAQKVGRREIYSPLPPPS